MEVWQSQTSEMRKRVRRADEIVSPEASHWKNAKHSSGCEKEFAEQMKGRNHDENTGA